MSGVADSNSTGGTGGSTYFDWVLLGGDDMYYIMENLREYISDLEHSHDESEPLYIGRSLRHSRRFVYNTGGPGYVLNSAAISLLASQLDTSLCFAHSLASFEDILIGSCLGELGIHPIDSRDELSRERFHWFDPYVAYSGNNADYVYFSHPSLFNLPIQLGQECCSAKSISFHNMKTEGFVQCFHFKVYQHTRMFVTGNYSGA